MKILTRFGLLLIAGIVSCDDKNGTDCEKEIFPIELAQLIVPNVTTDCSFMKMDTNNEEVTMIIQSQSEYEETIFCLPSLPSIDFKKFVLLAGYVLKSQSHLLTYQQVAIDCEGNYFMDITLNKLSGQTITYVYFFAVVERNSNQKPTLTLNVSNK